MTKCELCREDLFYLQGEYLFVQPAGIFHWHMRPVLSCELEKCDNLTDEWVKSCQGITYIKYGYQDDGSEPPPDGWRMEFIGTAKEARSKRRVGKSRISVPKCIYGYYVRKTGDVNDT